MFSQISLLYKRLLNPLIKYSQSKYAVPALIIVSFTESSFFIVPPDFLLIPMAFAIPAKALYFAFITTISSVLGGLFGYFLGFVLYEGFISDIIDKNYAEYFALYKYYYDKYDFFAILIAGFTPIPYKLATIASGVFQTNLIVFTIGSLLSRGARFFLIAFIIKFYHNKGKDYIVHNLKFISILSLVVTILLILVFIIVKN